MDLELQPDQELLRDTTRKFLHATVPLTEVRALAENPAGFDGAWRFETRRFQIWRTL